MIGSQTFKLMKNVTQSMAGRAAILYMEPLSMKEVHGEKENPFLPEKSLIKKTIRNSLSVEALFRQIIHGFYPELYSNPH